MPLRRHKELTWIGTIFSSKIKIKTVEEDNMGYKQEELVLKTVKEIVVKFIEVGNISPASFHDHFRNIYKTVDAAVKNASTQPGPEDSSAD